MNSLQGSLLGAVKLSSILPWERDADIAVLSSHFHQVINLHQRNPIGKLKICKREQVHKIENILIGTLDSIPSPSSTVKIQIMDRKFY